MFWNCNLLLYFYLFYFIIYVSTKPVVGNLMSKLTRANNNNNTMKRLARFADIIFPEDEDYDWIPKLKHPPLCSNGDTFCENYDNYPHSFLRNVLKQHPINKDLFGKENIPEFVSRDGGSDNFICKSSVRTIFPKIGKNVHNDWRIIINQGQDDGYIQGVVVETCTGKGKKCDLLDDLVDDYVTRCKQKYIYRRLLSINDNGEPVHDTFMLPSACCCTYRRNYDFFTRITSRKK